MDNSALSFEDYSAEGLSIIQKKPFILSYGLLYLITALLLAAIIWSFFTRLDVIISIEGQLQPDGDAVKVYSPSDGELVDLLVSEGVPVRENQVIARIKSSAALLAASDAEQAKIAFDQARLVKEQFPERRALLEQEVQNIENEITILKNEINTLAGVGRDRLALSQKNRLAVVKSNLEIRQREKNTAQDLFLKYEALRKSPGGGGISDKTFQEKRDALFLAQQNYQQALTEYDELEQQFNKQKLEFEKELTSLTREKTQLQLEKSIKSQEISFKEAEIEANYQAGYAKYQAALKMRLDNLGKDNFIEIRAPVDGEIVVMHYSQPGDKINSTLPLIELAPASARKVLLLYIPDKDRGLLQPGQQVAMKFHAFPYHRFGIVKGELMYVSDSAQTTEGKTALYKGYVSLEQNHVDNNGVQIPLRYGMKALAEITLQKKRAIDFILAPFVKAKK
jgi:hemolysin D